MFQTGCWASATDWRNTTRRSASLQSPPLHWAPAYVYKVAGSLHVTVGMRLHWAPAYVYKVAGSLHVTVGTRLHWAPAYVYKVAGSLHVTVGTRLHWAPAYVYKEERALTASKRLALSNPRLSERSECSLG
jgi:outer membrane scaffolding protein for murein synthesis (MipA/OmpV family)